MNISAKDTLSASAIPSTKAVQLNAFYGQYNNNGNHHHFEHDTKTPPEEDIENVVTVEVPGDSTTKYYVEPNETFTVEIHISNPKQYEIQSFTLNGQKYANYMFEENSTMELLLLEVTAPAEPGYLELTIDAIKYIDGTEIKDVRMKGDKTIKAGVAYTKEPTAGVSNLIVDTTKISLTAEITDLENVIGDAPITFYLSDGELVVYEQELKVGTNSVSVSDLIMGKTYEYGIATSYDMIDGKGAQPHWLYTEALHTNTAFMITDATIGQERIDFVVEKAGTVGSITSIVLIDAANNTTVQTLTDATSRSFGNLLSNHPYKITLNFNYQSNGETINDSCTISFTTAAKTAPQVVIQNWTATQTSLAFGIGTTDPDSILSLDQIELYKGTELISTAADISVREFNGLLSNNEYTVKVTYSYDLNDGAGKHTQTAVANKKTVAKTVPAVTVNNMTSTQTSLAFGIGTADPDSILSLDQIELYKGAELISTAADISVREFNGLLSNNEYTVKVTYSYDLNDGAGKHTKTAVANKKTVAKTVPAVTVNNMTSTQTSLAFGISAIDPDSILSLDQIELYKGAELISTAADISVREFNGLLSNNEYTVKVTYSYDLNDGAGRHTKTAVANKKTVAKAVPTITFENIFSEKTAIYFNYAVTDIDGILSIQKIELFDGETVIATAPIEPNVSFTSLQAGALYTARITYSYDLNDGNGIHTEVTEKKYPTLAESISIEEVILLNENVVKLGEEINLRVFFHNSSNIYLTDIYVNGQKTEVVGGDRITSAIVKFVPDDSGLIEFTVDRVDYLAFDIPIQQRIDSDVSVTYPVYKDLVVKYETVNGRAYGNSCIGTYIEFENADNYRVYKINNSTEFVQLADNQFFVSGATVSSIEYGYDAYGSTTQALNYSNGTNVFSFTGYHKIYTVEDLLAMTDGYYILMNDLDLRKTPLTSTIQLTGVLDGNGHTIRGLSYVIDTSKQNNMPAFLRGYIYDTTFSELYISVDNRSGSNNVQIDPFYSSEYSYTRLINCHISGDVIGSANVTCSDFTKKVQSGGSCQVNVTLNGTATVQSYTSAQAIERNAKFLLTDDYVAYAYNKTDCVILGYYGNDTEVEIPESIQGYRVCHIGNCAFKAYNELTSIKIPDEVKCIGDYAFADCSQLTTVIIGAGSKLTSIGRYAFYGCGNLTSITIPDKVIHIGGSSFNRCGALKSIYIPDSVANIGKDAFYWTGSDLTIYCEAASQPAGWNAEWNPGNRSVVWNFKEFYTDDQDISYFLFNDNTAQVVDFNGTNTNLSIPETINGYTVTAIYDNAFKGCTNLVSIAIPDSVENIGNYAFSGCDSLISINIPNNVTIIGSSAFGSCDNLTTVVIGADSKLTSIGESAFEYSRLENIFIPVGVTYIGLRAFNISGSCVIYAGAESRPEEWNENLYCDNIVWNVKKFHTDEREIVYILFNDNTASVYRYDGTAADLVIPETINGHTVTTICEAAFINCSNLINVVIPDSVTSIERIVFGGCTQLTTVTIGTDSKLTIIGGYAFSNCSNLTSINIPNGVTSIGYGAFSGCSSLTTVIIATDGDLTNIEADAFRGCTNLTSITIGNNVTSIGYYAFRDCGSLTSIVIPNRVTDISSNAFLFCNKLTFYCEAASQPDGWASDWNPENCPVVWNVKEIHTDDQGITYILFNDNTVSVYRFDGTATELLIPETVLGNTVTTIYDRVFQNHENLTGITLPDGVTSIGYAAFSGCTQLTTVTTGADSKLESIGERAFNGCNNLTGIVIPDSVTNIGNYAFYKCTNLTTVTIGADSKLESIGERAFNGCNNLTGIVIPDSVTSIGDHTFYECTKLTTVTIGADSKLESIGKYAFYDCRNLTSMILPDDVTSIGTCAFCCCNRLTIYCEAANQPNGWDTNWNSSNCPAVWNVKEIYTDDQGITYILFNDNTVSVYRFDGTATEIVIPDAINGHMVTAIYDNVFQNCENLTSIVIPDSVTNIGNYAFYRCSSLTSIVIPDGVASIGNYAFYHCDQLTTVTIGADSKLESIGEYAFYGCGNLTSITIPDGVTNIDSEAFSGCGSLTSITIPNSVTNIGNSMFYGHGELIIYVEAEVQPDGWAEQWNWYNCPVIWNFKELYTDENGNIYVLHNNTTAEIYRYNETATEFAIPETINGHTVIAIYDKAFQNCENLTSIVVPDGVTSIGNYAFYECTNLTTVTIGADSKLESIGGRAFSGCSSLTSIAIPDSVTSIGYDAFYGCNNLTMVTIGGNSNLESIGVQAFVGCNITSITIPDSVTNIGTYAFYLCNNLTIYCEAASQPNGWDSEWNPDNRPVVWESYMKTYHFVSNGGSAVEDVTCVILTTIPQPTKEGYAFAGWYTNAEFSGSPITLPYDNKAQTTLYAKWLDLSSQSAGLEITNGVITGIGTCTDTILRIALPIADSAFQGCTQIEAVYLLDGCTSVGYQAFAACTNLKAVYFNQAIMPVIGSDIFANVWNYDNFAIYVPNALLEGYRAVSDSYWQMYLVTSGKIYCI